VLWVEDAAVSLSAQQDKGGEPRAGEPRGELPPVAAAGAVTWRLFNKIDLAAPAQRAAHGQRDDAYLISSTTGEGVDELLAALTTFCQSFFSAEPALVTRERQRAHLRDTAAALRDARQASCEARDEIVAEHLRLATRSLGKLLGRVDVEDVLDVIFRDFCIGK
jgi:tRNA modification GTPase